MNKLLVEIDEELKDGKCPNGCGNLVVLEKPSEIFVDIDIYQDCLHPDIRDQGTFCTLIPRICPKCGFVAVAELTESQWQEYDKENQLKRGVAVKS